MFRKIIAATTTALVAGVLSVGAVAGPAFADGPDDTAAGGTTTATTTETAPAPAPDASAPITPPVSDATPVSDTTPAAPPSASVPSAPVDKQTTAASTEEPTTPIACLPSSAVSYSYDDIHNSGVITVANPDPTKYTDTLCTGFYVTAVAWSYVTSGTWPQNLAGSTPANNGQMISQVDTYPFGQSVSCGQGDIYASTEPLAGLPKQLTGPDEGYDETFLSDMGFTGPTPTYMVSPQSCHVLDLKIVMPVVTVNKACGAPGSISWTDVPGKITYALTMGNGTTGYNEVTATAHGDWIFQDNLQTFTYGFDLGSIQDCGATPGDPSSTPAACTDGTIGNGTIVVALQPGVLDYTLTYPDGTVVPVTSSPASVPTGTYVVHVSAEPGHVLQNQGRWTASGANDWTLEVQVGGPVGCDLPTDAILPTSVTSGGATCSTGSGSITVGPTADYLTVIDYFIDGKKVTQPRTSVTPGTHLVTAAVNQATAPGDTLEDPGPWSVTIGTAAAACGQLKTLALTGTTPTAPLIAAGVLLPAGVILLLGAALIRRRREQ